MKKQEFRKNEERLRKLWDNFKWSNIWIIGVPEEEKKEQDIENLFEKLVETFPNLAKEIDFQEVQEAQRVPKKFNPRKHTPKHTIITLPKMKDKERILKAARHLPTKESCKTISWFLNSNLSGKKGWKEVFEVMKDKDLHPRLFYPAKLSFRMEG